RFEGEPVCLPDPSLKRSMNALGSVVSRHAQNQCAGANCLPQAHGSDERQVAPANSAYGCGGTAAPISQDVMIEPGEIALPAIVDNRRTMKLVMLADRPPASERARNDKKHEWHSA